MKYKIEKENGITSIYDSKGHVVYWEDSTGFWIKRKFDENGNQVYWENSNDFWVRRKFDENRIVVYYEDSTGEKWETPKPKENIIQFKDLDDCLKKLKGGREMTKQKLTKEQRKDLALEEYWKVEQQAYKKYKKVKQPAWEKYLKVIDLAYNKYEEECKKIDSEPDEIPEIIEQDGIRYKRIMESEK